MFVSCLVRMDVADVCHGFAAEMRPRHCRSQTSSASSNCPAAVPDSLARRDTRMGMSDGTATTADSGQFADQPAWKALEAHHRNIRAVHLRDLFAQIRNVVNGWRSRPRACTSTTRRTGSRTRPCRCSVRLAEACGLRARIDAMFQGQKIDVSEKPSRAPRRVAGTA